MMALDVLNSFDIPVGILDKLGTRMSDDELMHFSEVNLPHRFERNKDGEITIMSPVGGTGSLHEGLVFHALYGWNLTHGRGVVFAPNAGFSLRDGSCLAPDGAWVSNERWMALTPPQQAGYPPLCPEFLMEVRSVSDARRALETKMVQWLDNGAQLAWLIDPMEATVTIYQPDHEPLTLDRPDIVEGIDPVAGFVLPCGPLWASR